MDDGAQETSHFLNAVDGTGTSLDWEALRVQSIEPYGFGPERVRLWYVNYLKHMVIRRNHM